MCPGQDLNLHEVALASPSSWCVCQFRHPGRFAWVGIGIIATFAAESRGCEFRHVSNRTPLDPFCPCGTLPQCFSFPPSRVVGDGWLGVLKIEKVEY